MAQQAQMIPDYRRIYLDIIRVKFPEKELELASILGKKDLNALDVINLNNQIFYPNQKEVLYANQKYKTYDRKAIFQILDFQKKKKLTNTAVADYFSISRNTISKWKKKFIF